MCEKFVCKNCIEDPGLQETVEKHQIPKQGCSYCGTLPAASLEDVTERIAHAISTVYGAAEDNYDNDGNPLPQMFIDEVFHEISFSLKNDQLMNDIKSAFGEFVYSYDIQEGFLNDVRREAWKDFQKLVKHQRRYTFSTAVRPNPPEMDELLWSPPNLLENIRRVVDQFELIRPIQVDLDLWRVRVHDADKGLCEIKDFTAPPVEHAKYSNRMSPAGVSMFYGAVDFETACVETIDKGGADVGRMASGMAFRPIVDFWILDLVELPSWGSFFNPYNADQRRGLSFLDSFAMDISKPIEKDGREHIEYVPSQVFTEYVRYELPGPNQQPVMGIRYRSSRNGRDCHVIFVEDRGCLPPAMEATVVGTTARKQFLSAVPDSLTSCSIEMRLVPKNESTSSGTAHRT